jgi:hypothetical protein
MRPRRRRDPLTGAYLCQACYDRRRARGERALARVPALKRALERCPLLVRFVRPTVLGLPSTEAPPLPPWVGPERLRLHARLKHTQRGSNRPCVCCGRVGAFVRRNLLGCVYCTRCHHKMEREYAGAFVAWSALRRALEASPELRPCWRQDALERV